MFRERTKYIQENQAIPMGWTKCNGYECEREGEERRGGQRRGREGRGGQKIK